MAEQAAILGGVIDGGWLARLIENGIEAQVCDQASVGVTYCSSPFTYSATL